MRWEMGNLRQWPRSAPQEIRDPSRLPPWSVIPDPNWSKLPPSGIRPIKATESQTDTLLLSDRAAAHRSVSQSAGNWFKQISWWVGGLGLGLAHAPHGARFDPSPMAWMQRRLECRWIESKQITHFLHCSPCFVISEKLQCRLVLSWRQVCHAYRSYWTIVISAEEHVMHVPHSGIHHK